LRNTDWLEADRTRKAEVRICHGNKRLTLPIMTRFDDVNKKEQKGATLHFLYAWNRISGRRFLVKTGRAWCCSSQRHPNLYCSSSSQLTTVIKTYGTGRSDQSGYHVADVSQSLLGAGFLRAHSLLLDVKNQRIVDSETFHSIRQIAAHTTDHIQTTGPPPHSPTRWLPPHKLQISKSEFRKMEKMGIVRYYMDSPMDMVLRYGTKHLRGHSGPLPPWRGHTHLFIIMEKFTIV
ncbi:hypothetical protein T4D_13890, partial [Trichinella pseudospiralis]